MGPAAVGNQSLSLGEVDTFEMFKTDVLCYLAVSVMFINGNLQQLFNIISEREIGTLSVPKQVPNVRAVNFHIYKCQ